MRLFLIRVPQPFEHAVKRCRGHFVMVAAFSAFINLLYLAPTIYMMQVYDRVVPTGGLMTLYALTLIVAAAIAILCALDAVRAQLLLRASMRINRLLSVDVMHRALSGSGNGPSIQAMRDFDTVRSALSGPGVTAIFDAPWAPLYVLVAFAIHPLLGVLVLLGGGVLVVLALLNERANRVNGTLAHRAQTRAYADQEATFRAAEVVQALGMGRALVGRHSLQRQGGLTASLKLQATNGRFNALVKFVRMFMQSLALGAGAWLAVQNQISVGSIIAASVLLSRALQPVEQIVGAWPSLTQARQSLASLEKLFAETQGDGKPQLALPEPTGRLQFSAVGVISSDSGTPLLNNVSFALDPGQLTGVVGPSGAGKTTLARAAAGAIAPHFGEILMDGARFSEWEPDRLARSIGYLPQHAGLLPGTVAENISRFSLGSDAGAWPQQHIHEEVVRASTMAGVHDTILRLPDGYQTLIGTEGQALSAGQAQRIALARALFGSPRVLILDEPNSALDAEGEEALGRAIASACRDGAAVMMVAHRANVLSKAHSLIVMHAGAIVKQGPRAQVLGELAAESARANVVPLKERASS